MISAQEKNSATRIKAFYSQYYGTKGADRNDFLTNPGVLYQVIAQDAAMIRALRFLALDPPGARVLDVGCGDGASMWLLLRCRFKPEHLYGVDIQGERIEKARSRHPHIRFECSNAATLPFADRFFDLVMESTMFIHATDDAVAKQIASEMIRVTKPGGALLLCDWRYGKPGDSGYKALTRKRIASLFQSHGTVIFNRSFNGALIPPVGRLFSNHLPALYFVVHSLLPVLVGNTVTVLTREK